MLSAGVTVGTVLADTGYGTSAEFRQTRAARGLRWAVGVLRIQKVLLVAGNEGPLTADFAAVRVRVADGPLMARAQHQPGEHVWLVCERRMGGERKYHLTNQPTTTPLLTLVRTIKARWVGEQAHGNALCRWPFARTRSRPGPSRTPRSSS